MLKMFIQDNWDKLIHVQTKYLDSDQCINVYIAYSSRLEKVYLCSFLYMTVYVCTCVCWTTAIGYYSNNDAVLNTTPRKSDLCGLVIMKQ